MTKLGLILEGGGVRGIYTAGVLDCFMENGIEMDAVFGVSAGTLHALNYKAKQPKRSYRVGTKYVHDKRYMGISSLIHTGDIFGADFCYHTLPDQLEIFDYDTYRKNPMKLYATVSNLETGKPEYVLCEDAKTQIEYVRASASLPLLSRIVEIDGKKYLDGGITDSIPLNAAIHMGYEKNIVVCTRSYGYQKEPNKMIGMIKKKYKQYPKFVQAADRRHIVYNEELKLIEQKEKSGDILVLRPTQSLAVKRIERDTQKIKAQYELGYQDAREKLDEIKLFIRRNRG